MTDDDYSKQLILFKLVMENGKYRIILVKYCLTCGRLFEKISKYGIGYWVKKKYCSIICSGTLIKVGDILRKRFKTSDETKKKQSIAKIGLYVGEKNHLWKGGEQPIVCQGVFLVKPYRVGVAIYCLKLCRTNDPDNVSPINERIRRTRKYKEWRKTVFERDNYTCQMCHITGGYLNADHILPFAYFPKLRFDIENGRTLCAKCHRKTETYGGRARKFERIVGDF